MQPPLDERLALPLEKGALLFSIRTWALAARPTPTHPHTPTPATARDRIQTLLTHLDAQDATPAIDALMHAIHTGATRPVAVQCVCCPRISADETALLDTIALAQDGRLFEALLVLREFLAPQKARIALANAQSIATSFTNAGRPLDPPATDTRQYALSPRTPLRTSMPSTALH